MAKSKAKTVFFCKECGYETPKWMGQCPGCHQWNTMTEEKVSPVSKGTGKRGDNLPRQELTGLFEVSMEEEDRSSSGIPELDRVLGGGIVKGSLTLVGGDPGIGKSTLLLQICRYQANSGKKVVYVSGEESLKQIKMRAQRLGGFKQNVFLLCETDINAAAEAVREAKPDMVVVDSVQTMYSEDYFCSGKCQSGARGYFCADAACKSRGNRCIFSWSCYKRRCRCRTENIGAYGGHRSLLRGGPDGDLPNPSRRKESFWLDE